MFKMKKSRNISRIIHEDDDSKDEIKDHEKKLAEDDEKFLPTCQNTINST